jgi:hypothetical protein
LLLHHCCRKHTHSCAAHGNSPGNLDSTCTSRTHNGPCRRASRLHEPGPCDRGAYAVHCLHLQFECMARTGRSLQGHCKSSMAGKVARQLGQLGQAEVFRRS